MHYGIVAIGSRGDVQPFVALALGLKERGHRTTVFAQENFKDFIEGYGIDYYQLYGNTEELLHTDEGRQILRTGNALTLLRYLRKAADKMQARINMDILSYGLQPDALVSSALGMAWVDALAEKWNKKWVVIQLTFPVTPTREFPFAGLDYFNFPAYNLFTYWLLQTVFWNLNKKQLNAFRRLLDLAPLKKSMYKKFESARVPVLYSISRFLVPRPLDWGAEIDITGFMVLTSDKRRNHKMDPVAKGLSEWLQAGEPPVYVGFGSMPVPDPAAFAIMLNQLLTRTGHRFIFCQGWSVLPELTQNSRLHVVKYIDHEWLLPQCKAAIIHGGVGTVAAVLRACIPLVVLSVFGDQAWWGKLVDKRKIGVHIPFKKASAEKLAAAVSLALSPDRSGNAREIGRRIRREDGLARTIQRLETYFES
jgi:UDP:flavonoid glycosyltransferase YjiC (YdhE family)